MVEVETITFSLDSDDMGVNAVVSAYWQAFSEQMAEMPPAPPQQAPHSQHVPDSLSLLKTENDSDGWLGCLERQSDSRVLRHPRRRSRTAQNGAGDA